MKKIVLILLCLNLAIVSMAHPWKPGHYIVVDTDGGIDDMRALTLLLASRSVQVLAITTSAGAVDAETNYWKVKSLLQQYNHQGVLVGLNDNIKKKADFMPAYNLVWGDSSMEKSSTPVKYTDVLNRVFSYYKGKVSFVCLGSMNTLATYLNENDTVKNRIKEVVWTVGDKINESYNYKIDSASYKEVNQQINLKLLHVPSNTFSYTDSIITSISQVKNVYTKNYLRSLNGDPHLRSFIYDEFAAMYLANSKINIPELTEDNIAEMLSTILNTNAGNKTQAFRQFPSDTSQYMVDIAKKMDEVIAKYGDEEWSACVLTNELHRHVGIYSLIGAKMGIRAREYFDCGADEMKVTTFVGSKQPLSCMNDGVQTSTGATIGHGLITVSSDPEKEPRAIFEYLGQKVAIELKPEYRKKLQREVKQLASTYGLDNNVYWDLLRMIALNCWFTYDRHDIFNISVLK